jgi:hypothetical protein
MTATEQTGPSSREAERLNDGESENGGERGEVCGVAINATKGTGGKEGLRHEKGQERDRKIIRGREKRAREREIERQCEEERGKRGGINIIYYGERKSGIKCGQRTFTRLDEILFE